MTELVSENQYERVGKKVESMPQGECFPFAIVGEPRGEVQRWFTAGLVAWMLREKHLRLPKPNGEALMVLNLITEEAPRAFRRQSQSIYVASIIVARQPPESHVLKAAYPLLVKSLSNLVLYDVPLKEGVAV